MKLFCSVVAVLLVVLMAGFAHSAGFVNGGFETGDFSGWTLGGPNPNDSAIVTPGTDPNTNNNLQKVSSGSYGARVGDQAGNSHSSTLSQTVLGWTDAAIYFAWAAVLQEPTNNVAHDPSEMPDFSVQLRDLSNGGFLLYDKTYNISNLPAGFFDGATNSVAGSPGLWQYNQWVAETLDTSAVIGHNLQLIVTATDCSLGGHGGYVYVDQVGSTPPDIQVPEPGTLLLLGCALAGLYGIRRKMS